MNLCLLRKARYFLIYSCILQFFSMALKSGQNLNLGSHIKNVAASESFSWRVPFVGPPLSEFLAANSEVPGSILGATRFSE
jgi:hypothetical protein